MNDLSVTLSPEEIRQRASELASGAGYEWSPSLPFVEPGRRMRSGEEIAGRVVALFYVFDHLFGRKRASADIRREVDRAGLVRFLTEIEQRALSLEREVADDELDKDLGWHLEYLWPLAWILGWEPAPSLDGAMIGEETMQIHDLVFGDLEPSRPDQVLDRLIARSVRCADEVAVMEDAFYLAHNASRNAIYNGAHDSIPEGIENPIICCGVIQERRHALTWSLSPGEMWDETDLST